MPKIYTKTGDNGETGLIGGKRVSKSSTRIAAYGCIDELNSYLGLIKSEINVYPKLEDISKLIFQIQNDLFIAGSDLADISDFNKISNTSLRITDNMVAAIEDAIDRFEEELKPITFFILPGGCHLSSLLHIARTVARRAETLTVKLNEGIEGPVNPRMRSYINRLSDLLFVMARITNARLGINDVQWKKPSQ